MPANLPPQIASYPALDQAAMAAIAQALANIARAGDVVYLWGDLGAGKSAFARALLRALQVTEDIPSPTYTLAQHYPQAKIPALHADLYRLRSAAEAEELGLAELALDHILLIEWPDRLDGLWQDTALHVVLDFGALPDSRRMDVHGDNDWAGRWATIKA